MIYTFYLETDSGIINGTVDSDQDFGNAPFGSVGYRQQSSCECSVEILDAFWKCVDEVLHYNTMNSLNFIRAIKCETNIGIFGEFFTHS